MVTTYQIEATPRSLDGLSSLLSAALFEAEGELRRRQPSEAGKQGARQLCAVADMFVAASEIRSKALMADAGDDGGLVRAAGWLLADAVLCRARARHVEACVRVPGSAEAEQRALDVAVAREYLHYVGRVVELDKLRTPFHDGTIYLGSPVVGRVRPCSDLAEIESRVLRIAGDTARRADYVIDILSDVAGAVPGGLATASGATHWTEGAAAPPWFTAVSAEIQAAFDRTPEQASPAGP